MANPIQPTPDLEGDDADRLLADLEQVCPSEEAQRRIEWAKREREKMMSRAADYAEIASGAATVEEVRERNALIPAEYCKAPIDWKKIKIKF